MREHRRLPRAGARDHEQRPGALRVADAMLNRELLLGIEIDGRARADQGERHGATQSCFALCSQGAPFDDRAARLGDFVAQLAQLTEANGGNTRVSPSLCTA